MSARHGRESLNFLAALALLILTACMGMPTTSHADQRSSQPNLVLIIADDMNWDDCGA